MADFDTDIVIVGGGLIGAMCLLALKNSGYRIRLIDVQPLDTRLQLDFDARSLALSMASVRLLQMLNLWSPMEAHACAITTIHVSQQGHFGQARLVAAEQPFGYVLEIQQLHAALQPLLPHQDIDAPAELMAYDLDSQQVTIRTAQGEKILKTRLLIAADGADSSVRQLCGLPANVKHYAQHALVANIGLRRSHHHIAYERFTKQGPLALLPMTAQRMACIWSLPSAQATQYLQLTDNALMHELQQAFGYRLGRFEKIGTRQIFPLRQIIMPRLVHQSVVFIGNAAHTLHPVAGQGFNLGLRDVAMLAQCIQQQGLTAAALQRYQSARKHDQSAIQWLTDGLIELFSSRLPGLGIARGHGLLALENAPWLKHELIRYAQGFGGIVPDLVCGVPLRGVV